MQKQLIFVLGMHRSGTSALTRMLSLCGATLPRRLLGPARGNPLGHWEALDSLEMNDRFLRQFGSSPYDPRLEVQTGESVTADQARDFESQIESYLSAEMAGTEVLVVKDPRISCLTKHWLAAANRGEWTTKAVFAFRSPWQVADSLADRDGVSFELSKALWLKYNLISERESRDIPRVFVEFPSVLSTWSTTFEAINTKLNLGFELDSIARQSIQEFLVPQSIRKTDISREASLTDEWTSTVFSWLKDEARSQRPDASILDRCYADLLDVESLYRLSMRHFLKNHQPPLNSSLVSAEVDRQNEQLNLCEKILLEVAANRKFSRIQKSMLLSPFRESQQLPADFNPTRYVLRHGDLYEAEVDPYGHYLNRGCNESRLWSADPKALLVSEEVRRQVGLLNFYEQLLAADRSLGEKLERIRQKVSESSFKNSLALPVQFNALRYLAKYQDLFDAEVDPFEHYLSCGLAEGRTCSLVDAGHPRT